ncbi:hypothetical protein FRC12_015583 [Ceratobasidium sp. 428]|nr:hypothetical protein FRC12_015583 [Ceratobasidium sp. 428]
MYISPLTSYRHLAAVSQRYRSLPDYDSPLERLSQLSDLLSFVLVQHMVGLHDDADEGPPYGSDVYHVYSGASYGSNAYSGASYGSNAYSHASYGPDLYSRTSYHPPGAHWTTAVNSAELNAAGVPYYTQTDSQTNLSHSTSTSTSNRARALTASANDNPRAPKRRVDYASRWRDDIYGTPPSVASEPAGMYSSAGVGDLGHETTGRIQLPPIQSNSVPVDSRNMAIHQSLPPSQFLGNPPANLPPIRSMFENSAPGLPGFASTYDPAPQTPTVPLRRRPVPRGSWGGGWGSVPVDYNPPDDQPFAQATDRRQSLHDPARAAHTPVRPANRPLKTPNASSDASRAHTPKQRPPQPITIVTTPTRASRDKDVIDLTHSSSPPDAATLFGPRRGPAPAPLIKQESFPLSLSGDHKRQDTPPPALPGPPTRWLRR